MARDDVSAEEVARRWLAGESYLALSVAYDMYQKAVVRLVEQARIDFPGLPWHLREGAALRRPARTSQYAPVQAYAQMTDGKKGARGVTSGSVFPSKSPRHKH